MNNLLSFVLLKFVNRQASRLKSKGTSVIIVAKRFESLAKSAYFNKFSCLFLPLIISIFDKTFSNDFHSLIRVNAVFIPMPGIPGILSLESPLSASTSINAIGSIPCSLRIFSISLISLFLGLKPLCICQLIDPYPYL